MLPENVNRAWPELQGRRLVIRKWLLSLRCDCITMVQPAESRQGLNLACTRTADFCRPTCWRVLREPKMRPVLVIVVQVSQWPKTNRASSTLSLRMFLEGLSPSGSIGTVGGIKQFHSS